MFISHLCPSDDFSICFMLGPVEYLHICYGFHGLPVYRAHHTTREEREGDIPSHFTTKYQPCPAEDICSISWQDAECSWEGLCPETNQAHILRGGQFARSHLPKSPSYQQAVHSPPALPQHFPLINTRLLTRPGSHSTPAP